MVAPLASCWANVRLRCYVAGNRSFRIVAQNIIEQTEPVLENHEREVRRQPTPTPARIAKRTNSEMLLACIFAMSFAR